MSGFLALVLHAHLPFVRHPEHARSLEEIWFFEAVIETYVPLLRVMEGWAADKLDAPLTLTLSPTLCAMLRDPLLQDRCARHLEGLVELAEKETFRTAGEPALHELARFYRDRFRSTLHFLRQRRDLTASFRALQDQGRIEVITTAATHAFLPLLAGHAPSLRAQILAARDDYRDCFGRDPRGIWLPECGYDPGVEPFLREAGLRWFGVDSHGLLHARPRPRYAVYAPVLTPQGLAAFARDPQSARQVWSRHEGYPGDPHYRDFYRDIGFDLDLEYVQPYLPVEGLRGFTGVKYHRVTDRTAAKELYDRRAALGTAERHARHFVLARQGQIRRLAAAMDRPPFVFCPYDAELFGHWWFEGPEFLDQCVRVATAGQKEFVFSTPEGFLRQHPTHQLASPAASSWGEGGYAKTWLNEKNAWVRTHLQAAQTRMTALARRVSTPNPLEERALRQAARELLLAQGSDWLFILHSGTSPTYASQRLKDHLLGFTRIYEQLSAGAIDEVALTEREQRQNLFPRVQWEYWR